MLNSATKKNIRKNIKDLTEEKFTEIYNLTLEYIKSGKGQNFNAILYKGLNNEGEYITYNIKSEEPKLLEENKRKESLNKIASQMGFEKIKKIL